MILSVKNISVYYGKAMALENVSLEIAEGSVITVIGANGSGKSTLLRTISGLVRVTKGEIWYMGKRIDAQTPTNIVKSGIVQVPEGRKLFPFLSVSNNLKLGASLRKDHVEIKKDMDEIFEHFPILQKRSNQANG
jgi:branched-chain amino acid transport system ATP-binding protein